MKLSNIVSENELARLSELDAPMIGMAPPASAAQPASGQSGQPPGGLDPKQAAMMIKQRAEQKKQVQDQIKQTEQQLADLRKQLAQLG
jgi:hypothetical protein